MTGNDQKLSGVVITYNEEKHIEKCLYGLSQVADEVVVVDSFSTDKTVTLIRASGARFFQKKYMGQIEQKQYALSLTNHDHVIALDGDEELTYGLIEEILREKKMGFPSSGYEFNRKSKYCGKWIGHGDWYPDWKLRLWNKHKAHWGGKNPHDRVALPGQVPKRLKGDLLHYTFETEKEHEAQVRKYAQIGAKSHQEAGTRMGGVKMIFSPVVYLIKNFFVKGGFRDGKMGWQITKWGMKEKWLKYKYLARLKPDRPM